ncbi:MAG TPA: hypothetical protein VIK64_00305 [Anaerolineales bacterium]
MTTRFLHLKVVNAARKIPFVPKQTAYACHGDITFLTDDLEHTGKSIQFKWDGTPAPIKPEILRIPMKASTESDASRPVETKRRW